MADIKSSPAADIHVKTEASASKSDVEFSENGGQPSQYIDPKIERSLIRKLDMVLLPCLSMVYLTHTLDRANLGNAKTDGLEKDLGFVGNQYSQILIYFYIPYALFTIPASLLSKHFNPGNVIPILMFVWGTLALCSAFVKNFSHLLVIRIFIGLAEAGFKPCVMYYFATFYTRREIALRMSVWATTGFIAGAVGGLISWDLFQWTNKPLHGWQYLFIIEGGLTMGVAAFVFSIVPRTVHNSRWFTEEEKAVSVIRNGREFTAGVSLHLSDILNAVLDWEVWAFSFMGLCYGVGQASSSNFLPSIVKRLTISTPKANLYTVGPNLVGAGLEVFWCWLSDRLQQRALVATGAMVFAIIGFICLAVVDTTTHIGAGYFFTYLLQVGTFTSGVLVPSWLSTNIPNPTKRATALGMLYLFTNLAGIISSASFRTQDAPIYRPALTVTGCFQAGFVLSGLAMRQYFVKKNKDLDSGKVQSVKEMEHNPDYRYAM